MTRSLLPFGVGEPPRHPRSWTYYVTEWRASYSKTSRPAKDHSGTLLHFNRPSPKVLPPFSFATYFTRCHQFPLILKFSCTPRIFFDGPFFSVDRARALCSMYLFLCFTGQEEPSSPPRLFRAQIYLFFPLLQCLPRPPFRHPSSRFPPIAVPRRPFLPINGSLDLR